MQISTFFFIVYDLQRMSVCLTVHYYSNALVEQHFATEIQSFPNSQQNKGNV